MQESSSEQRSAASVRTAELAVAGFLFALGAIVIWDSLRLGARWIDDGPQAGYFPFFVGLIICIVTGITFVQALFDRAKAVKSFVSRTELAAVLKVLVPAIVYAILVRFLGIYVASAIYIGFFMIWLGRYSWMTAAAVGAGVMIVFFLIFDVWFRLPLPKGPVEALLGLN